MTCTPNLAPASLPRQQRRAVNRELHRLLRRDDCSICGQSLAHNSTTTSGVDAEGNVVLAGECCANRVAEIFGVGFISTPQADTRLDDIVRRGGGSGDFGRIPEVNPHDGPWKEDD